MESWKSKLTAAEVSNGKQMFSIPGKKSGDTKESAPAQAEAPPAAPAAETKEEKKSKPKAEKKEKPPKEKKEVKKEEETPVDIGRLDLRVGHIRKASKHPDADSLYLEEIDCGEEKPRQVISGLVKFIPEAEMQDRLVVVLCNLKPSKMRGIVSEAMVMCASTPEKVEILAPPPGSKPGDLVMVDGFTRRPDELLNPKKKIFETCAPDLKVNQVKQATYKVGDISPTFRFLSRTTLQGVLWTVNGEPVTSQSMVEVQIK